MSRPLAVSFGGGLNSVAMLIGFRQRGVVPDLILFADTKSEFPETYALVKKADAWCQTVGFPRIETVFKTYRGHHEGLEQNCLRNKMLPGLAYGTRSCSIKYKGEVLDRRLKQYVAANGSELPAVKAIGYDAGEPWRAGKTSPNPKLWTAWYPLIEWGWDRERCRDVANANGFSCVQKSACFFCPAMKKGEIVRMAETHPDLMERALTLEENASGTTERGLGGVFKWSDVLRADRDQMRFDMEENVFVPCGCVE